MRSKRAGSAPVRMLAGLAFALAAALFGLSLAHAQADGVRFYGPLSRVITPNGDRVNDTAFFCFENPQRSEIGGKIYTLLGAEVARMGAQRDRAAGAGQGCPASVIQAQFMTWDGMAGGTRVRSGIYVYRLTVEDKVYSGTLLVVR